MKNYIDVSSRDTDKARKERRECHGKGLRGSSQQCQEVWYPGSKVRESFKDTHLRPAVLNQSG